MIPSLSAIIVGGRIGLPVTCIADMALRLKDGRDGEETPLSKGSIQRH